ncbi:ester cyclase [Haladaptatus sp. DJG-WS-42]|uniref:ester cyclase n=1 Tax=Haladaptatus sp. DJG-WS-42 TaxID=3120516 RepID=UPI0030D0D070
MASKATRPAASPGEIAQELWTSINEGDFSVVDTYVSENYVEHDPNSPAEIRGREGFRQNIEQYFAAFPDMDITIEDLIEEGDKVVTRWSGTGTHKGELMGIAPTDKSITVTGLDIERYEDGMLTESWSSFDALGLMRQLGAFPDAVGE